MLGGSKKRSVKKITIKKVVKKSQKKISKKRSLNKPKKHSNKKTSPKKPSKKKIVSKKRSLNKPKKPSNKKVVSKKKSLNKPKKRSKKQVGGLTFDDLINENTKVQKEKDFKFEWGFDLTNFNDSNEKGGDSKFLSFLSNNDMIYKGKESDGFVWGNEHVKMITSKDPITGKDISKPDIRKGYLGAIKIIAASNTILSKMVRQIRSLASSIKDESPDGNEFM
jgi:hypothetical protein